MKKRKFQSVLLAASGLILTVPMAARAADTAVHGVVRDASGVPQMDVLVQLMRADSTIIKSVRTDAHGTYLIGGILPGVYQLKAIETSFLPTLRENLRVSGKSLTEANLTLSTLMESLSWLPAHRRSIAEPEDDWTWTLRSAAYRPLLRYVGPDGLETIDSAESRGARTPRNKGRLLIESGTRSFGEGGVHQTIEFEHAENRGGQTLLRGRVGDAAGSTAFLAGYAQQNAVGSGLTTAVSYQSTPQIAGAGGGGMETLTLRTLDLMKVLPEFVIEAGNQLVRTNVGAQSLTAARPFANASWTHGDTTLSYSVATAPRVESNAGMVDAATYAVLAGEQNGVLRTEHGLHQEVKLEHATSAVAATIALYNDEIDNPMVDAMGPLDAADLASGNYLFDSGTGIARVTGANYGSHGVVMQVRHQAAAANGSVYESIEYATGNALKTTEKGSFGAINDAFSPLFAPKTAQSLSLIVGGKTPLTGTTWKAAYRMQPGNSLTAVDLFDEGIDSGMADAYLSMFLRQPLHRSRVFPGGVDAVVNVRNLLAQGYHPFLTADGSTLFFAQLDRSIQGGLAFYF